VTTNERDNNEHRVGNDLKGQTLAHLKVL